MTSELLANIERFENARDELRELVREAHATIRAVRTVAKELDEQRAKVDAAVDKSVQERIAEAVGRELDNLGPQLKDHMDRSVEHLSEQFRQLERAMFKGSDGTDLRNTITTIAETGTHPMFETRTARKKPNKTKRTS